MANNETSSTTTDTTCGIVVRNTLPDLLVAVDSATVEQVRILSTRLQRASALFGATESPALSPTQAAALQDLYAEANTLGKAIEEGRKAVKAPVLDVGRAIDAASKPLIAELDDARRAVGPILIAWQRKEDARIKAEQAERARLEAERKAAEAQRESDAAAAEVAGVEAPEPADALPVVPDAPEPADALPVVPDAPEPADALPVVPDAPEPAKRTVREIKRTFIDVVDESKIPRKFLTPDMKAIKAAVKRGEAIPGVEVSERIEAAATGR